jgi:hypothetical protein
MVFIVRDISEDELRGTLALMTAGLHNLAFTGIEPPPSQGTPGLIPDYPGYASAG